ncbi:MAG: hypothetical protein IPG92_16560 [Flavobacteriales bacterium]|nr:hypothetical protein [Flavobacteriales bacterium]
MPELILPFLTADHGAVDVPQYVKDMKGSAGYVDVQDVVHRAARIPLSERRALCGGYRNGC